MQRGNPGLLIPEHDNWIDARSSDRRYEGGERGDGTIDPRLPIYDAMTKHPRSRARSTYTGVMQPHLAVSPDGKHLAFVAQEIGGPPRLWLRIFAEGTAAVLPETEDAMFPFWSPDSRSIGFFARARLRVFDLGSTKARTIAEAAGTGGTWSVSGEIVFGTFGGGALMRVPAAGGEPTPAVEIEAGSDKSLLQFPKFLPDGQSIVYWVRYRDPPRAESRSFRLDTGESHAIVATDAAPSRRP